jgi:ankyrin repeat protein
MAYNLQLSQATDQGTSRKVKQLLQLGADPNFKGTNGTPLWNAAWGQYVGHSYCIQELLAVSAIDVNKGHVDGRTPLWHAAYCGRKKCLDLLLAAPNIDVNKTGADGKTPLMIAVEYDKSGCVESLLRANGVNINAVDNSGRTALMMADLASDKVRRLLNKATRVAVNPSQ